MIYREATDYREKGAGQNKAEAVWPAGKEEHMAEIDLGLVVGPPGEPGTTDYQALENKPRINGTVLEGDTAPGDLGVVMAQEGMGLSHNDYTDLEKAKLAGIADDANKYVHPESHPASMITQDTDHRFVTDTEKDTWNGIYERARTYADNLFQSAGISAEGIIFAQDEKGNWGYIPPGADTVIPFKSDSGGDTLVFTAPYDTAERYFTYKTLDGNTYFPQTEGDWRTVYTAAELPPAIISDNFQALQLTVQTGVRYNNVL